MAKSLIQLSNAHSPVEVIEHPIPSITGDDQVLVQMAASPVNRVDLMTLTNLYPVKPQYHVDDKPIPGFDGCGIVLDSSSPAFKKDDLVLPRILGLGTWRTHAVWPASSLLKLPRQTPPLSGALLRSGALVAWLLCEEITPLTAGDWVILSAGTSSVAQFFIQFARLKRVNTILVVRDRANIEETRGKLLSLGASLVLAESELAQATEETLPGKVKLALDSVFGQVGEDLARVLSPGGKFVLVGMLAGPKANISVTTGHLFYKQLSFLPFRSSEILKSMGDERATALIQHVATLLAGGSVQLPELHCVSWNSISDEESKKALEAAQSKEVGYKKTVWLF
ncbi:hypothetical protein N7462_003703 [Penicillium macrosclerotiorum]|uniref:uncharacterized protein n=1 Tax=Penicillium macrosclerotiorum TaxID=303699 RepID=UPI0025481A3C|nr:uncharacterized protein N7462_003703 [Penicillium macrosclerotiorum]KAJ5689311.1 hypothetical protein N7462_003703 [Penicillium macrosclerotiorum]